MTSALPPLKKATAATQGYQNANINSSNGSSPLALLRRGGGGGGDKNMPRRQVRNPSFGPLKRITLLLCCHEARGVALCALAVPNMRTISDASRSGAFWVLD